jgi:hypothetical protein
MINRQDRTHLGQLGYPGLSYGPKTVKKKQKLASSHGLNTFIPPDTLNVPLATGIASRDSVKFKTPHHTVNRQEHANV